MKSKPTAILMAIWDPYVTKMLCGGPMRERNMRQSLSTSRFPEPAITWMDHKKICLNWSIQLEHKVWPFLFHRHLCCINKISMKSFRKKFSNSIIISWGLIIQKNSEMSFVYKLDLSNAKQIRLLQYLSWTHPHTVTLIIFFLKSYPSFNDFDLSLS